MVKLQKLLLQMLPCHNSSSFSCIPFSPRYQRCLCLYLEVTSCADSNDQRWKSCKTIWLAKNHSQITMLSLPLDFFKNADVHFSGITFFQRVFLMATREPHNAEEESCDLQTYHRIAVKTKGFYCLWAYRIDHFHHIIPQFFEFIFLDSETSLQLLGS